MVKKLHVKSLFFLATLLLGGLNPAWADGLHTKDVITAACFSTSSYSDWTDAEFGSNAKYAGNTKSDDGVIQMRSTNSSGIVTTTSGGRAKKITVDWNSKTAEERTIDIYAKNTPYTSAADLYSAGDKGAKIGSIKNGETTSLTFDGNYAFIGIRSKSGALYADEIQIEWDEEIEIEIGESLMTTFSFGTDVDFNGSGMTAYKAKASGATVVLTAVKGNTVPANTGVVLAAEEAKKYTATFTTGATAIADNDMVAQNEDGIVEYDMNDMYNYILQTQNVGGGKKKTGFYMANDRKLRGGKAYLSIDFDIAASRLEIEFDGESTGIAEVIEKPNDNSVYNLQGQRVCQTSKGLYIVDGKKVFMK